MAYNPITGKAIKTGIQNKAYNEGWDKAFAKKTAHEWLKETPEVIRIVNPNGWAWDDGVTMDTPIKWSDFNNRLNHSTVIADISVK
jgi:hypothetical protein